MSSLKRVSWLNTTVGAIPGAIPPMMGWSAYTNNIGAEAWILFAIMFMWQHPHFFAIGWIYRKDYKKAQIKLLPTIETSGKITAANAVFFTLLLIPISLLPTWRGISGSIYFYGAFIVGFYYLLQSVAFYLKPNEKTARKLLYASFVFVPALLLCFFADSYFVTRGVFNTAGSF